MNMKDNKYLYYGYLLLIGVVFYVMNVFTPFYADDWHFKYIFGTLTEVKNIGDLFYSLYLHYLNFTWRVVPHFFVILFDGLLGKSLFNLFNAAILVLFFHLLSTTISDYKNSRYVNLSISVFLIFILVNGFGDEFLWMSGACNYLWCGTILLLFNRLFHKEITSSYYLPLLLLFGIISGWTNESFVIGMAMGFLVYIWDKKGKISRSQWYMLVGFFIGVCFLVFSPASYGRFERNNENIDSFLINVIAYIQAVFRMNNVKILPTLLVLLVILFFRKKDETKVIIKKNKYLIICILVTFIFVIFTKESSNRSRFGIEFFSLLFILQLLAIIKIPQRLVHIMNISVLMICIYSFSYLDKNYSEYKNVVKQIEQGKELILTNEPKIPSLARRFVVYYSFSEDDSRYAAYNKKDPNNLIISFSFGDKLLAFLPERLYKEIKENPDQYNDFSSYPNLPFYIKKYNGDKIRRIYYISEGAEAEDLPFYMKPFVRNNSRYARSRIRVKYTILNIDNDSYLIIDKNKRMNDDRIKEIVIE